MSTDKPGLTEEDYEKIEEITKYGTKAFRARSAADEEPPEPEPLDDRGLSIEQCNAIRAAATDGHSYRYIASLFSFITDPTEANRHATGRCQHGRGDHPAVLPARDPGPPTGSVSQAECLDLRRELQRGRFLSVLDASKYLDRSESVARRHLHGECEHDTETLEAPDVSPEDIKRRRASVEWSQYDFAEVLGVSRTTVSMWETGDNNLGFCVAFAVDAILPDVE